MEAQFPSSQNICDNLVGPGVSYRAVSAMAAMGWQCLKCGLDIRTMYVLGPLRLGISVY